jgi:hypothetical protein
MLFEVLGDLYLEVNLLVQAHAASFGE